VAERLYRRNPLLGYSQQSAEPFYFDQITSLRNLSDREREWLDEVSAAGFSNGLGVQVFGPGGRNGYFGLGFRPGVQRMEASEVPRIQGVCQMAHLRYCAQIIERSSEVPTLSERETEVLVWVARGKSNTTIGEILGISAHTVDAHLRRIYLKLGVYDRMTAAIRGIGLGLIHSEL
jgi:LuxR family transcriptional regulator/LuxR family quorum-sensing system transcriptional regulator CciR